MDFFGCFGISEPFSRNSDKNWELMKCSTHVQKRTIFEKEEPTCQKPHFFIDIFLFLVIKWRKCWLSIKKCEGMKPIAGFEQPYCRLPSGTASSYVYFERLSRLCRHEVCASWVIIRKKETLDRWTDWFLFAISFVTKIFWSFHWLP